MLIALDHIIIGVHNLKHAAAIFSEKLGLITSGGGNHPNGGTANRIIVIDDTYLELIAIHTPEEAQISMLERLSKGEGYLNFVVGSNNIAMDSQAMQQRGVQVLGPNPGELKSGDGNVRGWLRTDIERPEMAQHYPFIIQHDSSGEERRKRLAGGQLPPTHPLGIQRVRSTTIAVADLQEATQRFQQIYGIQPTAPQAEAGWGAHVVSFQLAMQTQSFELAAPLTPNLSDTNEQTQFPETGALAAHLQHFGESLCRITLEVENLAATRHYLDTQKIRYTEVNDEQPTLWIQSDQTNQATIVLLES